MCAGEAEMDITFTCKCGQEIVIDEAGAGITVDCPGCGKPVYVPSKQPPKAKDIPVRIETPLAQLMAKQGGTSSSNKSIHPTPEAVARAVRLKRQSNAKERTRRITCLCAPECITVCGLSPMRFRTSLCLTLAKCCPALTTECLAASFLFC